MLRGIVRTRFELQDKEVTLVLDFNAFAEAEPITGLEYPAACVELDKVELASVRFARAMIWASALRLQPGFRLVDAGDLLAEHPDLLNRLVKAASPTPAEQERLGN